MSFKVIKIDVVKLNFKDYFIQHQVEGSYEDAVCLTKISSKNMDIDFLGIQVTRLVVIPLINIRFFSETAFLITDNSDY